MHALGGEKLARNRHVLGCYPEARALLDGRGVVKVVAHGHADAALGDLQIQRLVQALAAMFEQGVLAGNAHVGTAVLHIGGHVGGAHHQHPHVRQVGVQNQLARFFRVVQHLDAGRLEQGHGFFEDAAFGECEGNHFVLSMSAPMARSLASIWS